MTRTVILATTLTICLAGCYGLKQANKQHGRAVSTFPEIGADYCDRTYPVKDGEVIKGDTVVHLDTIYGDGQTYYDTIRLLDTVRITKIIEKPIYIYRTTFVKDTIVRENIARLELCAINRDKAIQLLDAKTKEYDKWRSIARKRFWIIVGLGAGIAIALILFIRKKFVK